MQALLDQATQQQIAQQISFVLEQQHRAIQETQTRERDLQELRSRPSILLCPSLTMDGNQWCALYGENLQEGVAGFGDSPEEAMLDFDRSYAKKIVKATPGEPQITIPLARLRELEQAEDELAALREGGVDNWEGYPDAMRRGA